VTGITASDKVVILDRDGTVVIDRGYLDDPAGLEFEPGAAEALKWLYSQGFRLVVITNQSGVGRGLFNTEQLEAMSARLHAMVESAGARLERIYVCPHAPSAGCECRKPALGLLKQAVADLGFNPAAATMIGDKESDIEFGRRAGARTILISHRAQTAALRIMPDLIARDMMEAARAVISP
jgi:D-glycero-D-manno-heptose 1,7-bisphosphate phosphatase